jgi:hypothetical protein
MMNKIEPLEKKCKYCGKPIRIESKYASAEISHWDCLYDIVKPVRDGLKK